MRRALVGVACALTAAASCAQPFKNCQRPAMATALSAEQTARFEYAKKLFMERRFPAAYARFASLADAGHLPSAQVALLMYTHGGPLFGSSWGASNPQLVRWSILVACDAEHAIARERSEPLE